MQGTTTLMLISFLKRVSHKVLDLVVPYPLYKIIKKLGHATWLL